MSMRDHSITVPMSAELKEFVETMARRQRRSTAAMIRLWIEDRRDDEGMTQSKRLRYLHMVKRLPLEDPRQAAAVAELAEIDAKSEAAALAKFAYEVKQSELLEALAPLVEDEPLEPAPAKEGEEVEATEF